MIGPWSPAADLLDAQSAAVVSVTWAGRIWRLSSVALTGDAHIDPGLVEIPDLDDEISIESGGDVGATASIAVVLPCISIADYTAAGYDPTDITAEIAIVYHRGGVLLHGWAARDVRLSGWAIEPEWGDPTQPAGYLACTVEDSPYRTERPICRWAWAVSTETWPTAPEFGARYPLVIGAPDPDAVGEGPPAPLLAATAGNADLLLVSIGWCLATTVTIIDDAGAVEVFTIEYREDGLGQVCAVVDVSAAGTISRTGSYTSAWTAGPALAPLGGVGPLHIAAYLLSIGGADLDLPEWARLARSLDLPMGGYVDDPETAAWEVARDLLTGLPVTMRRARDGWAPVLTDPHLSAAVDSWPADGPWRRVSSWASAGESRIVRAEVTSQTTELRAGEGPARNAALPHAWARHYPGGNEAAVQSSWSWSAATDWRMLGWIARIGALGWEAAAFQVPSQWARAQVGEWVDLPADGRAAMVQRRTLADGLWDYTLIRPAGR
jgi:hypothetical protein